jgi:hypothetical protein
MDSLSTSNTLAGLRRAKSVTLWLLIVQPTLSTIKIVKGIKAINLFMRLLFLLEIMEYVA